MSSTEPRERERAQRHQLIITAARELAEAEGWEAVTTRRRRARLAETSPGEALRAVSRACPEFAVARPALYEAMFVMPIDVPFASQDTPPALRAAFDELVAVIGPGGGRDELYAEVIWSALHGLAVLAHGRRMPAERQQERLEILVQHFAPDPADLPQGRASSAQMTLP